MLPLREFLEQFCPELCEGDANLLADMLVDREAARQKETRFRPLTDYDLRHLPKVTHSYISMPEAYPSRSSGRSLLAPAVNKTLNREWVSAPIGSEHGFKNQYEEELFKCEENMYEYDHYLFLYRHACTLL